MADLTCDISVSDYFAIYEPNSYTCNSGQYLPANALGCVSCPTGLTCNGGTFDFNADIFQGLSFESVPNNTMNNICANNFPDDLTAIYEPNVHNCNPGYYLPANIDECRKCLNDHYCPGGNLTFNETTPQGIISCPENHPFAPAGMWLESQCGRKLHVGNDVIYMHQQPAHPTIHRLYIGHPNGIYSANAVQRDMNSNTFPKMSEGMSKGFHVTIDNVEYLICDDSVLECRND